GPHFEEGVYRAPASLPADVEEDIRREVTAAHRALGITDGPTHTELRLRGGVTPYLLEMGARIGGSGVSQYIASGVTGIDFAAQALRIAAGTATEPLASDRKSTRLNSSHVKISYAVFCLKKKNKIMS